MRASAIAAELVALGPRVDDSAAATAAVDLIDRHLRAADYEPEREVIGSHQVPEISLGPWRLRRGELRDSGSENIWVRIGGAGPARVLMAHYDSVPGSPGAIDNAVAVGILLEVARCLVGEPPPGPVVIAFTGGEERGLIGARRLAETLGSSLEMAVSFDLVGHQVELAINGLSAQWDPDRLRWLRDRVQAADVDASLPLQHRLVSRKLPQLERSDHGVFTLRGVPAAHLYGRGAERIYLAYHTPLDDMSRVAPEAVDNALRLAVEIAGAHAPLPERSGSGGIWVPTPIGVMVAGFYVLWPLELVLAIAALTLLLIGYQRRAENRSYAIGIIGALLIHAAAFLVAALVGRVELLLHGNPLAPIHDPLRFTLVQLGVAAAAFALIALAFSRWASFVRCTRFHVFAAAIELAVGVGMLAVGALEVAWWPLLVAVLFALAGRLLERPIACTVLTVCGIALAMLPAISPAFLREALFHGFYPRSLPLAGYLAVASLTSALALVGAVRARLSDPSRAAHIAMAISLVAAIAAATAMTAIPEPRCTAADSATHGLACELPELQRKK